MAKDSFYYELDQEYRGTRVRVFTDEFEYELAPLRPYLEEKLASTRSEAIRQGYL